VINRIKNRIAHLRIAPHVKCSNCKALCEYRKGTRTCWACEAEIVLDDDTPILMAIVQEGVGNQPYTFYLRCPNCWRLLSYGTEYCHHCREELSEGYAFISTAIETLKTAGSDHARTIASLNPYAVMVVIVSLVLFAFSIATREIGVSYLIPFMSVAPLLAVLLWFYRYGFVADTDEEYLNAKREVKHALKLWLLIFAFQVFVLFLLMFPH